MIWREPQNHHDRCYFCVININDINSGNRNKWSHLNLVSVQRPIPHSGETSTCFEPDLMEIEYENITDKNQGRDLDFSSSQLSELFNQNELNPIKNSNFVNSMNELESNA
jgi:hypothetical protein